ncbi:MULTISPECIES: DUF3817 domain-containing protein [Mycolicibacterium]|uniref:DUF3817 domain-containing protein n=2 Tax=Mycolicibacterium gilvum TaxID=1804 RepID=E6TAB2_MYCSR|nr:MULTISPECIES: DUF3817 domain-containing protein [Mycolicibacterium]ABP44819.1 conserved hypothetical protein [Mycolicibacterium gilvum PYR-GCK]ADT98436.1 hypothetical protein Mspyr1_17740 [Mycolicibacterium gilvum Spyr1]MBV5244819.1 DUF3817 domain-containing protein [Mycolicibacterium sp. PAM1]
MTSAYDLRTAAGRFRVVAFAEAVSWVGLLLGMYFKYIGPPQTEIGVKIFGPIHGGVFVAFLIAALMVGVAVKWDVAAWLLALLGSIVPLGSVIFLIWADRTGRMGSASAAVAGGRAGASVPETT